MGKTRKHLEDFTLITQGDDKLAIKSNVVLKALSSDLRRNQNHPLWGFFKSLQSDTTLDVSKHFFGWYNDNCASKKQATNWPPVPDAIKNKGLKSIQVLYVDPPWQYYNSPTSGLAGLADTHYDTCNDEVIFNMMDAWLDPYLADDCVLAMWATGPKMHTALATMSAWRFDYKNKFCYWLKTYSNGKPVLGLGTYTRTCVEELLLGTRGKVSKYIDTEKQKYASQILESENATDVIAERSSIINRFMCHSEKPAIFRNLVGDVFGKADTKVELFARDQVEGWIAWGNQVPKNTQTNLRNFFTR